MLLEWESGGALKAVAAARPCPCGCRFRHLHGRYARFVVVGGRELVILVPRLFCPECGQTAAVRPWFLASRSPYPWRLRQAAVVSFLAEQGGYRVAAARVGVAWQLVWTWVEALAEKAKTMLIALAGVVLRYPGPARHGPFLPTVRDLEACRARARSPSKRDSLAALRALLVTAYGLWLTGSALGLGWGRPDPAEVLGFLGFLGTQPA